ncbi:MAG: ATP-binding protein [Desulfuromonadaceae bacterium]|nr:ATP-binding protein [Desulfuromonadaceae bacterium]MDD5107615.1 ATP-binding protein [Desulfuromonadaceae bacterium]
MPKMTRIAKGDIEHMQDRVQKLAQGTSHLQRVNSLMNKVSAAQGLDDIISVLLTNILDIVGGNNITLFFLVGKELFSADVNGTQTKLVQIDDELVKKVFDFRVPVEVEHGFSDARMLTPEFAKTYTGAFPLVAGHELIGVIKLESMHISMDELYSRQPVFFSYVANLLKNEIYSQTRLKQANDQLSEINEQLELEIGEREEVEEELRQSRNDLEEQVSGRTAELESLHVRQEELIRQRTEELLERSRELQGNQQALMNIVDDLNQKTDELEQANAKLKELDRLKSMFIASMSHELRTPLNSIIGFSSILRDEWIGPVNQEQKDNLDTIKRSGKHLLSLINDVIDVSKIEAKKIEARFEEFDLYDLLTEAVQYVEKDLHEKGLELQLDIGHRPLCTDKRRLLQCVINLLSNAVKFTEHGTITVCTVATDTRPDTGESTPVGAASPTIEITIEDTGIGIAEEDIHRLFEAFVRLESPLKTASPGTGLGLYLTRKLVAEVLGGEIFCKSMIGVGSSFTLRIPERIYEKGTGSRG